MRKFLGIFASAAACLPMAAWAQFSAAPAGGPPTRTTFVPLANNANAILVEPVTADPAKNHIVVLVTHPERINTFNYFIGRELPKRGYRTLMLNYFGEEQTYDEFYTPIAAAIKALRATPGVQKIVLAGHSTGGPELTAYQDVAENGPKACQGAERIYKCRLKTLENLPKADGVMLIDSNAGAPERTISLNPAVDAHHPRQRNASLDLFDPKNGFNPEKKSATYSPEFLKKFFAAQGARANQLIDEAQARLLYIEQGKGEFRDDEPFMVAGTSLHVNGARPELADTRLLSRTHAPHLLLKADGSKLVQIIPSVMAPQAAPADNDLLFQTALNRTVRHYLSFQALRVGPDYRMTEDNITGIQWRSTANSIVGNLEGVHVPTLVMSATCAPHLVFLELAYDHSAAADKEFVGVEGANHGFAPCRPEFGDPFRRAFDHIEGWLGKAGRF